MDTHAQMRRHLAHAFSEHSLGEQEALVSETVDKFIYVAGQRGAKAGGFDMGKGLEMMTFDIIGDLAFGETFGGVDSGTSNLASLEEIGEDKGSPADLIL